MSTVRNCPQCADARLEETDDYDAAAFYCPSCSYEVPRERASVPDPVADTARALAGLWSEAARGEHDSGRAGRRLVCNARRAAIEDAARACGPQVEACFRALVTGDAGREVGRG